MSFLCKLIFKGAMVAKVKSFRLVIDRADRYSLFVLYKLLSSMKLSYVVIKEDKKSLLFLFKKKSMKALDRVVQELEKIWHKNQKLLRFSRNKKIIVCDAIHAKGFQLLRAEKDIEVIRCSCYVKRGNAQSHWGLWCCYYPKFNRCRWGVFKCKNLYASDCKSRWVWTMLTKMAVADEALSPWMYQQPILLQQLNSPWHTFLGTARS